ncbi:hypothetical protein EDC01DRAFT_777667 [Geopyxis carbonaria]|nr:hypothetical protein EDC01DRAFT_777667 [Geopyxis carbonaria]
MSSDSTPTGTPLETPEGSVYTPSSSFHAGSDSLSFSQSSFIGHPSSSSSHELDVSSLPDDDGANVDDAASVSSYDDAEAEWQESLRQLELLVSMVVIPFFGKWN